MFDMGIPSLNLRVRNLLLTMSHALVLSILLFTALSVNANVEEATAVSDVEDVPASIKPTPTSKDAKVAEGPESEPEEDGEVVEVSELEPQKPKLDNLTKFINLNLQKNHQIKTGNINRLIKRSGLNNSSFLPSQSVYQALGYQLRDPFIDLPPTLNTLPYLDENSDFHLQEIFDIEVILALLQTTLARVKAIRLQHSQDLEKEAVQETQKSPDLEGVENDGASDDETLSTQEQEAENEPPKYADWATSIVTQNMVVDAIGMWFQMRNYEDFSKGLNFLRKQTNKLFDDIARNKQHIDRSTFREQELALLDLKSDNAIVFQYLSSEQARLFSRIGQRGLKGMSEKGATPSPQRFSCTPFSSRHQLGVNELRKKYPEKSSLIFQGVGQQQSIAKQPIYQLNLVAQEVAKSALKNALNGHHQSKEEAMLTALTNAANEYAYHLAKQRVDIFLTNKTSLFDPQKINVWQQAGDTAKSVRQLTHQIQYATLLDYFIARERKAFASLVMQRKCQLLSYGNLFSDTKEILLTNNEFANIIKGNAYLPYYAKQMAEAISQVETLNALFLKEDPLADFKPDKIVNVVRLAAGEGDVPVSSEQGTKTIIQQGGLISSVNHRSSVTNPEQQVIKTEQDSKRETTGNSNLKLLSRSELLNVMSGDGYTIELIRSESATQVADFVSTLKTSFPSIVYKINPKGGLPAIYSAHTGFFPTFKEAIEGRDTLSGQDKREFWIKPYRLIREDAERIAEIKLADKTVATTRANKRNLHPEEERIRKLMKRNKLPFHTGRNLLKRVGGVGCTVQILNSPLLDDLKHIRRRLLPFVKKSDIAIYRTTRRRSTRPYYKLIAGFHSQNDDCRALKRKVASSSNSALKKAWVKPFKMVRADLYKYD